MAVSGLVLRISGTVAFSDGSHSPFDVSFTSGSGLIADGIESNPFPSTSLETYKQLDESSPTTISSVIDLLPSVVSLLPDAPTTSKTVSDATFFVTGTVAYDDNNKESFAIEYYKEAVNHFPTKTASVWTDIAASLPANAAATSLLELLAGDGKVTL